MAIKIKHLKTQETYILIGTGLGMYQSSKPHALFGDWAAETSTGNIKTVCACDSKGKLVWLDAEEVQVIEIDGKAPSEHF